MIMCAKFGVIRFRGYGVLTPQNRRFPSMAYPNWGQRGRCLYVKILVTPNLVIYVKTYAVCMASALNTSTKTSSSCPRFSLASDCARPPVPTSWFLPHAGLHLATEHSRSQELERGTHCRPVSPLHHLCPHSGDS